MKVTGEQVVLEESKPRVVEEHVARYEYVKPFVKGKIILDIACGTGYGSKSLKSAGASQVIGVDISRDAVEYAREHFNEKDITFFEANASEIKFVQSDSIDIITTFETIEHVDDETRNKYLKELHRVLKNNGLLFLSTPNRRVVSPNIKKPLNPYHVHEYLEKELIDTVEGFGFKVIDIKGQRIIPKILNVGIVRRIMIILNRIFKGITEVYFTPNSAWPVSYNLLHEPRNYFLILKKY